MASEDDNYGSLYVKGTPVAELKVNDIKKELDKRGLSKAGSKTQMLERLKAQLLLEKLQQDAAQSSGDELEGKVPNMALQQESAGQSEFVRQYLEQQQRNLERQMEVKKQVEEERKRKSADESSADETVTPQDISKPKVDPEVTSPKKFKDDSSNAPATDESKMPRPARKSSRNASKGENGQDSGVIKEESRSPSPEKESLRERTRSGSSSSSRSATPEATTRRGRSIRGVRGGRRGGRRGRGRPQVSRKESRSSSHSSTEEEVMPKKRSRRSTNSISSRSRSRSPTQKTSPEVTPATRRSSRRVSAAKTPPDHDLSADSAPALKSKESVVTETAEVDPTLEKSEDGESKASLETTVNEKAADMKEVRRSVEVLEPAAGTIKTIEVANMSVKDTTDVKPDNKNQLVQEETPHDIVNEKESNESKEDTKGSEQSGEESSGIVAEQKAAASEAAKDAKPESRHLETPKSDRDDSTSRHDPKQSDGELHCLDSYTAAEQPLKDSASKQKSPKDEDLPDAKQATKEDKNKESSKKRKQRRDSSSSSSSSSRSPLRKTDTKRNRSDSSGSSTDVSSNIHKDVSKPQTETRIVSDELRGAPVYPGKGSASVDVKDQESVSSNKTDSADGITVSEHKEKKDGIQMLPKKEDNECHVETNASTGKEMIAFSRDDNQPEEANCKGLEDKAADKSDQPPKTVDEEAVAKRDKTAKKRKWGSKSSKTGPAATKKPTSMEISSDSLKNLIGDVKLSETVFDMETEVVNTLDYDEHEEDRRDVKVKRTVVKNSPPGPDASDIPEDGEDEDARMVEASGDGPDEKDKEQEVNKVEDDDDDQVGDEGDVHTMEPKKKVAKSSPSAGVINKESGKRKVVKEGKKVKKKKGSTGEMPEGKENKAAGKVTKEPSKIVATTRPSKPILPVVDEPEKVPGRGDTSPARHPPDRVLRIAGLVRPFTLGQLKELLKRTGELDEEHFWINDIKSHCLAAFKSEEDAVKTRLALHGTRWPQSNPKILIVDFATIEDLLHRKSGGEGPPPALMKKNQQEQRNQRESREEQKKDNLSKDREGGEKADLRDARRRPSATEQGDRRKDTEKPVRERERPSQQIREWDKDKMKQPSRSRSKSKDRDRPARRSRSRERDQRKRRDGSREKREDEKKKEKRQKEPKAEEEPPAKLLDDLFRKTKATPCIYWLPLTEEQAQQRALQREEREKEKQKRIAAAEEKEKEELKKREAARIERQKQREKERDRSRERERSGGRDRDRSRDRARGGRTDKGRASRSRSTSGNRSRRRR